MEMNRRDLFASIFAFALMMPVVAQAGVAQDKYDRLLQRYQALQRYGVFGDRAALGLTGTEYIKMLKADPEKWDALHEKWDALIDAVMIDFPIPKIVQTEMRQLPDRHGILRPVKCRIAQDGSVIAGVPWMDGEYDDTGKIHYLDVPGISKDFVKSLPDSIVSVALFRQVIGTDKVPVDINRTKFHLWAENAQPLVMG